MVYLWLGLTLRVLGEYVLFASTSGYVNSSRKEPAIQALYSWSINVNLV